MLASGTGTLYNCASYFLDPVIFEGVAMKWNVGFVGFGFIGKIHALAYRSLPFYYDRLPGHYHLKSVATSRRETAEKAKERFGFDKAAGDWREVIGDPSIHIIHVAQPNRFHKEVLLAAIAEGKHIYCEKPLTADWNEAQEVYEALPRYKGTSQMCVQNRFQGAMLKAAELARNGFPGEITAFRGVYLHSGNVSGTKVLNWKAQASQAGGGVINDLAPHLIDLLQLLCGRFRKVWCHKRLVFPRLKVDLGGGRSALPDAEDHAVMMLQRANEVTGTAEVSKAATGTQDELRIEVHGTKGALSFDLMNPYWLRVYDQRAPDKGWSDLPVGGAFSGRGAVPGKASVGWMRGHIASLHHFLSAVARNEPAQPDLRAGVQIQAVLEAAYRSSSENRWVDVPFDEGASE